MIPTQKCKYNIVTYIDQTLNYFQLCGKCDTLVFPDSGETVACFAIASLLLISLESLLLFVKAHRCI